MAPKQKAPPEAAAAAAGFKSLFGKREPKAKAETPESKSADARPPPQSEPKRRRLDETAAAAPGGGGAEKAQVLAGDGTGPISIWTLPAGSNRALLSSPGYDPALRASEFTVGKPIGFALLSGALSEIEALKGSGHGSRKKMTIVLTNLLRTLLYFRPEDLVPTVYFVSNKVAPDYEQSELGIGDSTLISAMAETFGRSQAQIKSAITAGDAKDLGEVALQSRASQKMLGRPPKLMIAQVFGEMKSIAAAAGKDCGKLKKDKIKKMLVASQGEEAKYIVRMLQSRLRIGILMPTMLEALAHAFVLTVPARDGAAAAGDVRKLPRSPSLAELDGQLQSMQDAVRQAFCEVPNFELITKALFEGHDGRTLASACHLTLGIPVKPMLAKPSKGIPEVVERLSGKRFTGEWKYDGERAQIHIVDRSTVKVYSRNSEDMTEKYPDVIKVVKEALADHVQSGIVDSEVVAYDLANKKILPFQILSTRARKNINIEDIKVQVCIMPFDCMFYNGEPYLSKDLETRRTRLRSMLHENEGKIMYAIGRDFDELKEDEVQTLLDESIAGSCEGLMLKTLNDNAAYMPAKRSVNWLKLKKDYIDGVGDSIDVVPIGAFYGKGKRHGAFGAFLLAVYDAENEEYQTVCKAGTGFSDESLHTHHEFFKNHTISAPETNFSVNEKMKPDVWLEACQVWEIKAADLSISPVHTAAMGIKADGKGIALRFPRFLRIRDDKQPEEATGAEQIVEMFESQATVSNNAGGDEDDF
eukprot:CAMPEP_0171077124 /NCGR_PEP_ID=MMETSP0766_2-20121228/13833_1 /TAXON_ID=439317 /ORGANISM="Gambierdiscus australes, Strain CAWD 149" /LENGTH=755 /DNA_ID=CAMNT_0011534159 /DNA_START=21 /DNA_END=2288 /DNA_ORIENTATION=-